MGCRHPHQNEHNHRPWRPECGGWLFEGNEALYCWINIGIQGKAIDEADMVADISASLRDRLTEQGTLFADDERPVMVHESNLPNRIWYIGVDGLVRWDEDNKRWVPEETQ